MAIIAALAGLLPEVGVAAEAGTAVTAAGGAAEVAEGGATLSTGAGALTANNALGTLFGQAAGAQQTSTNIALQGMQTQQNLIQQEVAQNDKNAQDTLSEASKKHDPMADDGGGGGSDGDTSTV